MTTDPRDATIAACEALNERKDATIARLTAENEAWRKNSRDTFEAMCAMRDAINEHIPMPSLESDLLQGPESSVFCKTVAASVIGAIEAARAQIGELEESQANNTDWFGCNMDLWSWLLTKPGVEEIELADGDGDAVVANFKAAIEAMCAAQIGAVLREAAKLCWSEVRHREDQLASEKPGSIQHARWTAGKVEADLLARKIEALSPDAPAALERALRAERNKTRRECAKIANDNFECPPGYYGDGPGAAILAALEGQP